MYRSLRAGVLTATLAIGLVTTACTAPWERVTGTWNGDPPVTDNGVLAKYVQTPDPIQQWTISSQDSSVLSMTVTSGTWHGTTWTHQVMVIKPRELRPNSPAVLWITGDGAGRGAEGALMRLLADRAGAVVAVLGNVPRQPLFDGLREDALIAFSFARFAETGDTTWPALLPMTRAAVYSMTAIQEAVEKTWAIKLRSFLVTGASKRGWTTWLTAACDKRVTALAPIVYDNLGLAQQIALQKRAYGTTSEQIHDYSSLNLTEMFDTEAGKELVRIVDPLSYRSRLTQPKLIINGANDPYWVFDSARLYLDHLKGPTTITIAPNAGHGLNNAYERVVSGIAALHRSVITKKTLVAPQLFTSRDGNRLKVRCTVPVPAISCQLWYTVHESRDLRQAVLKSIPMTGDRSKKTFETVLDLPAPGQTLGFYADVTAQMDGISYTVSSTPVVVP